MRAHLTTLAVGTFLLGATALAAPSAAQEDCGFVCDGIMTTDDVPSTELRCAAILCSGASCSLRHCFPSQCRTRGKASWAVDMVILR